MADQDDQTAVRVSGGVIYREVCLCVCVWLYSALGPSLPPLSNHRVDLWPPQGGCESPVVR